MGRWPPSPRRCRTTTTLRERIRANLAGHERRVLALDERRHAAVAVVVVDSTEGEDRVDPYEPAPGSMDRIPGGAQGLDGRMFDVSGGAAFLLCRRAARLNRHASQWALPGRAARRTARRRRSRPGGRPTRRSVSSLGAGRRARDDGRLRHALRATSSRRSCCGAAAARELRPHPDEVLACYRVGLHQLLRDDSPRFVDIPESDRPVVQVPLGRDLDPRPDRGRARAVPLARPRGPRRPRRRLRAARLRLEVAGSAAGVAEAAAAVDAVERVDDLPGDLLDALHDELGDAVAAVDRRSRGRGRCSAG